jgi:Protein of unknown function (DUF1656)
MIAELDFHGVFVPALLVWAVIALPFTAVFMRVLKRLGIYRFVWREPLFDLALFTIVLGGVTAISKWIVP